MSTEVNETIRALTVQTEEYKKEYNKAAKVREEILMKAAALEDETYDYLMKILENIMKWSQMQVDECETAKREIMDKFDILYSTGEDDNSE